jgi:hypothetical protein
MSEERIKAQLDEIFIQPASRAFHKEGHKVLEKAKKEFETALEELFNDVQKRLVDRFRATTEFKYEDNFAIFKVPLRTSVKAPKKKGRPKKSEPLL